MTLLRIFVWRRSLPLPKDTAPIIYYPKVIAPSISTCENVFQATVPFYVADSSSF